MTHFRWSDCELVYDDSQVVTHYPDETRTGGPVVPEDHEHAGLLGISPLEHRLVHEMAHHLTARALSAGEYSCPILWAAAHQVQMPANAQELEWYYTAITYFALRGWLRQQVDSRALVKLMEADVDVLRLARQLRWSLAAVQLGVESVTFKAAA